MSKLQRYFRSPNRFWTAYHLALLERPVLRIGMHFLRSWRGQRRVSDQREKSVGWQFPSFHSFCWQSQKDCLFVSTLSNHQWRKGGFPNSPSSDRTGSVSHHWCYEVSKSSKNREIRQVLKFWICFVSILSLSKQIRFKMVHPKQN